MPDKLKLHGVCAVNNETAAPDAIAVHPVDLGECFARAGKCTVMLWVTSKVHMEATASDHQLHAE